MKITVMCHTASEDDFLSNQGMPSYAAVLVDALSRQDFPKTDFELVYVDRWAKKNWAIFRALCPAFRVKHVEVHPDHRYWFDKGYCYISAAKNTGLLYAGGRLVITLDDSEVFNTTDFLSHYWKYFEEEGRYLNAGYCRWKYIKTQEGIPVYPLVGEQYMNDSRHFNGHVLRHETGNWLYAGCSFGLDHAININGFNERIDGTKSLEDCDFGIRLQMTGGKFVMDRSVYIHIIDHQNNYKADNLVAVENYGTLRWGEELGITRANTGDITQAMLDCCQKYTIQYRHFDPLLPENADKLKLWKGTPTFNLAEQREELRRSANWKW